MIHRRPDYEPTAYDDDWGDIPASGSIPKWIGGVAVPMALIAYGITCIVTRHGEMPGRNFSMEVSGANAVALAVASVNLGVFLHCHYFWGNIFQMSALAVLGKIVSLIGMIGGLGYLLIHVGVLGN